MDNIIDLDAYCKERERDQRIAEALLQMADLYIKRHERDISAALDAEYDEASKRG